VERLANQRRLHRTILGDHQRDFRRTVNRQDLPGARVVSESLGAAQ
jgi:hypothetical protein